MSSNFNNADFVSLFLRLPRYEDLNFLFLLHTDERVMRYTGELCWTNIEESEELITNEIKECSTGICRYVVCLPNGIPIGFAGFRKWNFMPGPIDISFRFMYEYWNMGYASKCIELLKQIALQSLQLNALRAQVHPQNTYSIRVLEKCGFNFSHTFKWESQIWLAYQIMLAEQER